MKLLINILLLLVFIQLKGQTFGTYEYDHLSTQFEKDRIYNQNLKIKSLKVYQTRVFFRKRLITKKLYNEDGNIVNSIDHHYIRFKDYDENKYAYDSIKRIKKIEHRFSLFKSINTTEFVFDQNRNVSMILLGYADKEISNTDTINYFYKSNNELEYRIEHVGRWHRKARKYFITRDVRDTVFYLKGQKGNVLITPNKNDSIHDYTIRDSNNCIITYTDTLETKTTYTRDAFCNILTYKEELKIKGNWVTSTFYENKYDGQKLVECKYYEIKGRGGLFDVLRTKLRLKYYTKYEYNKFGQTSKEIDCKKNGKIKRERKFVYEYYP